MSEFIYNQSSVLIAFGLFAGILITVEVGFHIGLRQKPAAPESIRPQLSSILAAVLGILALLLGFTFSLALQRHDSRAQAVVDEANAIGTAYLRAQLLPAGLRERVGSLLRDYVDLRVRAGSINLGDPAMREPLMQQAGQITDKLWDYARQSAQEDGRMATSGLFIQSLNDLIDAYGRRDAALTRHVPEVVLLLLFVTFLIAGSILGYTSGIERHRAGLPMIMMVALIVVLVFLIIDLDRPRRGLIQVSQKSLEDLQHGIANQRARADQRGSAPNAPSAVPR